MKVIETKVYTVKELQDQFPEGFERALENYRNTRTEIFWQDEIVASFKACVEAAGLRLLSWNIGAYNRGNGANIAAFGGGELTGKRAFAWLENNLLAKCRIPWTGKRRWDLAKYGAFYRPGLVKPCPFTGYCADEDMIDSLRKDIRGGCTVKEAFENLADTAASLIKAEDEDQNREDYFIDHADVNDWQFTEDGELF